MMELHRTIAIASTLPLFFIYCLPSLAQTEDKYYTRADLFKRPSGGFTRQSAVNKTTFNEEEKQKILDLHNAYRSIVMPSARDMAELAWDDDLEAYAINHTQVCTGAHSHRSMVKKWSSNPRTWETWTNMGENLYYSYADRYSIEEALYLYWEEGSGYDIETHNCTHKQTCGHYRALVESRSNRIGCAINICEKFSISRYPTPAVFFQCVYNGAFLNPRRPYTPGPVCIDCNRQTLGYEFQFCRNRLCISPQMRIATNGFDGNTSIVGLDYEKVPFITTPGPTTTTSTTTTTETPTTTALPTTTSANTTTATNTTTTTIPTTTTVQNTLNKAASASFNVTLCFILLCFNVFIFKTQ